jgi:hypothetical protein
VRAAFFVLLFANLVFLAWAGWVDSPQQAKTSDATARLPRLKLVTEEAPAPQSNQSSGAIHKMAMIAPGGNSAAPAGESTRCVSIGPFNDINVAAKAAGALQARGLAPQQRGAAGETRDGYWVYIAGVADAVSADRIFKTLDRSGIKDARIMPESGDGRRISVGLFSDRERADRRAKVVERLGFKPSVGDHMQAGTVYWLDLILKASDGSVPIADLLSVDSSGGALSVQSCPTRPAADPAATPESAPISPAHSEPRVPPTTVAGTPKLP